MRFCLSAPRAEHVTLTGHFQLHARGPWPDASPEPIVLERGADGIWFHEMAPLESGFYQYRFGVDGVPVPDPQNPLGHVYPTGFAWSYVDVPASPDQPPAIHQRRDTIPHGTLHRKLFTSDVFRRDVSCLVYTPPLQRGGASTREPTVEPYPVLYLLHGWGHDERSWCASGRAAEVIDNLIASGAIAPIVVVMPYGQVIPLTRPDVPRFDPREGEYFLEEVAGVAARHHVRRDSAGRAIAGLSMGGQQALRLMALHPGHFAAVGAFACALNPISGIELWTNARVRQALEHVRLLHFTYGHLEGPGFQQWFPPTIAVVREQASSIPSLTLRVEVKRGAHQWPVWTSSLADFLQAWQPIGAAA